LIAIVTLYIWYRQRKGARDANSGDVVIPFEDLSPAPGSSKVHPVNDSDDGSDEEDHDRASSPEPASTLAQPSAVVPTPRVFTAAPPLRLPPTLSHARTEQLAPLPPRDAWMTAQRSAPSELSLEVLPTQQHGQDSSLSVGRPAQELQDMLNRLQHRIEVEDREDDDFEAQRIQATPSMMSVRPPVPERQSRIRLAAVVPIDDAPALA